jgi:hypothetical protein
VAQGIYPVFKPKLQTAQVTTLGEVLVADLDDLEEIADENDLTPMSAFMDNREVPDDFDGTPEELDEAIGEWNEWFEPAAGADALEALAASVGDHERAEELANELQDIARVLRVAAKKQGMKFRLELG